MATYGKVSYIINKFLVTDTDKDGNKIKNVISDELGKFISRKGDSYVAFYTAMRIDEKGDLIAPELKFLPFDAISPEAMKQLTKGKTVKFTEELETEVQ